MYHIFKKKRTLTSPHKINDIAVIRDELWIATSNGIYIYHLTTGLFKKTIKFNKSLDNQFIQKILYDPNYGTWFVTPKGLFLCDHEEKIVDYTKKNGLINQRINHIMLDHKGKLWIASQSGFGFLKNDVYYNYNLNDGLKSSFYSKVIEDKNQNVWIAGNKGVLVLDNSNEFVPKPPPRLTVHKNETLYNVAIIDFTDKTITTEYRLKNKDKWIRLPDNSKSIDISNFGSGTYTIQFRSRNSKSTWVYSQTYSTKIPPVWYKRISVITFFILVLSSIIIGFIYFRLHRIKLKNNALYEAIEKSTQLEIELRTVRDNIAQDFHDELGNKLAGIKLLSDYIGKEYTSVPGHLKNILTRVGEDSQYLLTGLKDFVWSIDVNSDLLSEFSSYLIDFGKDFFDNTPVQFTAATEIPNEPLKLPHYWNRQLLFIFKESMTNTLKHANASKASLMICLENRKLSVSFSDNGISFNLDNLKRINGINNIKRRAKNIEGTIRIETSEGTRILFTGNIPKKTM